MTITTATRTQKRERNLLDSATLSSGSEQVIDFLLPVFAGTVLGLVPWQIGLLVGLSELTAFVSRPIAGRIADRHSRPIMAAAGAAGFGIACVLYAFSTGLAVALTAAALSGVAGAFLWVGLRAMVAESLHEDSSVFAKLLGAEETGSWLIFVPALFIAIYTNYLYAFLALALCCFVAAALLFSVPRNAAMSPTHPETATQTTPPRSGTDRPLLIAVVVTMAAESALGLLLLLHLQHHFDLGLVEIALVFLPGAIAMSLLPSYLHRVVAAIGRRKALVLASALSTCFAIGLAFATTPLLIGIIWVLSAIAWSILVPVQQAAVADAAGNHATGRALSRYEAATLAGGFVGSVAAGLMYQSGSWLLSCLAVALLLASGIFLLPWAIRALGISDAVAPARTPSRPEQLEAPTGQVAERDATRKSRTQLVKEFLQHSLVFWLAVIAAKLFFPQLEYTGLLGIGQHPLGIWRDLQAAFNNGFDLALFASAAIRLWAILYLIDLVWTGYKILTGDDASARAQSDS
ncbi:MFS transporter [Micrococcoides hystricis]|uniref:MFS transporter n=1 Tax=Micrococcoides hystricis TaxID=1572761 RepID=A0ABV6PCZ4_9MICC